jgi:hypothetical protein
MIDPTRAATAKIASAGRPFTRGGRKLEKRAGFGRRERKQLDLGLCTPALAWSKDGPVIPAYLPRRRKFGRQEIGAG